ncbi:MAG: DUF4129 domain-containing protein [Myxococcales bacterium]|nr:DUF4129 domain-containing protein [Myxococcales bacterium]
MSARLLATLPLLLATLLFATGGAPFFWPLGLAVVAVAAVVLPWRSSLTTFGALLWMIAGAAVPILWVRTTTTEPGLGLSAALLCASIAVVRLFFKDALFGRNFDRALVLVICIAEGIGVKSAAYPYLTVLVALSLLVDAAGGAAALRASARTPRAAASVVLLSVLFATFSLVLLPVLDRATNQQFQAFFARKMRRTGFTPHVRLDQSGFITTNEDIVLRLHGPGADYLRGAVFDSFDGAYWTASKRSPPASSGAAATGPRTDVEAAEPSRWLFSPRASRIVSDTAWEVDALGSFRPRDPRGVGQWTFEPVPEAPDPPTPADLSVPAGLVPKLEALALSWTSGAVGDRARANALIRHLQTDFVYSLARPAVPHGQLELLDFLFVHREGHCEFFASAFIVLARVLGIPARLVAGFRVVERNGFGGYAVVRAKHAHAWAEAYVTGDITRGGQFEVFDATPAGVESLTETRSRTASAFFDYVRTSAAGLYDRAVAAPERTIPVLGAIAVGAFIVRTLRSRRRKANGPAEVFDAPPPAFVKFEARLAELGFVRERAETLESLAERLSRAEREAHAQALRSYARARYGKGAVSERELAALLDVGGTGVGSGARESARRLGSRDV